MIELVAFPFPRELYCFVMSHYYQNAIIPDKNSDYKQIVIPVGNASDKSRDPAKIRRSFSDMKKFLILSHDVYTYTIDGLKQTSFNIDTGLYLFVQINYLTAHTLF